MHERGTAAGLYYLGHGAAAVDVYDGGLESIDDDPRRMGHHLGVRTEQLDGVVRFVVLAGEEYLGLEVAPGKGLRTDHLGVGQIAASTGAHGTVGGV